MKVVIIPESHKFYNFIEICRFADFEKEKATKGCLSQRKRRLKKHIHLIFHFLGDFVPTVLHSDLLRFSNSEHSLLFCFRVIEA